MRRFRHEIAVLIALSGMAMPAGAEAQDPVYARRWFYASNNLLVDRNADELIAIIRRAGKSGYNGLMLADYKFHILGRMPERYVRNVERVRRAADEAGLEIIPALFPIGYSAGLLAHDPNLAEGIPVVDAPFLVQGRQASLDATGSARYVNGDLERAGGDRFAGMAFQDDPGVGSFADRETVHGGGLSCRFEDVGRANAAGNARIAQRVEVRPRSAYRFSCWVKTAGLEPSGGFRLLALGAKSGRPLTFYEGGLERDGDWKRIDVVFNTLDETAVTLYAGIWGGKSGKLWVDDLALDELSLVNILRRPGCPLRVRSADGSRSYEEGRDYEPVADPKLGRVPYDGEYDFNHDGPPIRLTADSRIQDGERLLVSWYHPAIVHGFQVACCLSEPAVYDRLRDEAERVIAMFRPRTVFMSHDELRVANWCQACQATGKPPGVLLGENARRCVEILRSIDPKVEIAVWSDMFDPHHNAVSSYYLVNGSLQGSWESLPPDVLIANWNSGKAAESLKFFAGRGHRQVVAGYYDASDLGDLNRWNEAARGVIGVEGFMYTTWQARYDWLERYGQGIAPVGR